MGNRAVTPPPPPARLVLASTLMGAVDGLLPVVASKM